MASTALWTLEAPARTGLGYLPSFLLLDVDGRVLMKGNTVEMKSKISDAIEEQIRAAKDLPEGYPKAFQKAWTALRAGEYEDASAALDKLDDPELGPQVQALRERLREAIGAHFARIERLQQDHQLVEARAEAAALSKAIGDLADFAPRAADVLARFDGEELKGEMEAALALEKVLEKVRADGIEKQRKALEKFAERHAGTGAAQRASHLASLSG
jgi:hypothetical protein